MNTAFARASIWVYRSAAARGQFLARDLAALDDRAHVSSFVARPAGGARPRAADRDPRGADHQVGGRQDEALARAPGADAGAARPLLRAVRRLRRAVLPRRAPARRARRLERRS